MALASLTAQERLESLKAGILAGAGAATATGLFQLLHLLLLPHGSGGLAALPVAFTPAGWLDWAIATFSAALFGITYRYAVRTDSNPHLKSGVVGAFALVRALALVEMGLMAQVPLVSLGILAVESGGMVAIAFLTVDGAIRHHWLRPCK
ncbi:MAG: hypothetical protein VKK04_03555 [Synechococcales bacterium]|nr:hypothetical protein [Synechococcales bacterium]